MFRYLEEIRFFPSVSAIRWQLVTIRPRVWKGTSRSHWGQNRSGFEPPSQLRKCSISQLYRQDSWSPLSLILHPLKAAALSILKTTATPFSRVVWRHLILVCEKFLFHYGSLLLNLKFCPWLSFRRRVREASLTKGIPWNRLAALTLRAKSPDRPVLSKLSPTIFESIRDRWTFGPSGLHSCGKPIQICKASHKFG